ncbi:uncharacterized protein LOC100186049 isoform X2 [Ciona intestinalis]
MKSEDCYPTWKGYLFRLQQEAPKPRPVLCQNTDLQNRPHFYGPECHGLVSREEGGRLCKEDGDYLIRESQNERGRFTLVLRVLGLVKNFKLYYEDGKHFVGEKRFDSVYDLAEDGLITMFVEDKAQDYIERMVHEPVYNSLSRYSAAGSRAGTMNGRHHTPQVTSQSPSYPSSPYAANGAETESAAMPHSQSSVTYTELGPDVRSRNVMHPVNPAYDTAEAEYGLGYVPRFALEPLDYVTPDSNNYQRYHDNTQEDMLLRRNECGGIKKNLTPTSSDERKRTKKRFATENEIMRYQDEQLVHQQQDLYRELAAAAPDKPESKPRRASHGVTSHPNMASRDLISRRLSAGTAGQPNPAYHRPAYPQHQPTTVAHVKQLSGGLDTRLTSVQASPRRENENMTRNTRFMSHHASFEDPLNPYNVSSVKESLPAVREGNSLEQIMAVHRHLEEESSHGDVTVTSDIRNIHVRQRSEPTELLYQHQKETSLFDSRIHESAIYQDNLRTKDALLRHKLRQRQHSSNDRAGSIGSCESGFSNSSSNSSVPITLDKCDTSSSHFTDSGSRVSSEDDRNTPSPRHGTGLQGRAGESPKMGYSPSKPARHRQTCQQADIQSESPWQPRDDVQQTPTPRIRSSSSPRKRPPLTLHNPNYNDVIGTDVTSQQKDKDNKQENTERTRSDVITHKEDMNPAYRVTRQGTVGEQISPDDVTSKNVDQTAPPVSKDKKRITKVSSVPDVPPKSRPILRRATTNDLLSKAKNGRTGQPSVKEKSSPQIDEKVSHGKLKKTVTSPAMQQRSVTSPTSRHRGTTSPSKKSPSKVSRTKCLLAQQYEKEHHYKSHTYRGLQWCEYCGNFMWGIIQQGVQCVDCGLNVHKQCAKLVPNDCQPALKHIHHVFGVDLTTLVKLHGTQRPLVVDMCIAEIEKRGMDSEGIYRIPGFHDDVIELKAAFDQLGTEVNMAAYEDVNTIAGALKLYLRELPVPLLPYRLYSRFINAAKISHENGKLDAIRMALSAAPGAHFETIKYLIQHLGRVSERSNENQMSTHNLGIVFGPTLLRAPENDVNQRYNLNDTQFQQEAIASMIGYRHHLFGLG